MTLGIIVCLGVFAYSAFRLFTIYQDYKVGEDEYAKLQGQYTTREVKVPKTPVSESVDGESPNPTEEVASAEAVSGENAVEYLPLDVDFQALQAINPDVVGWLEVEALDISYPIVQGRIMQNIFTRPLRNRITLPVLFLWIMRTARILATAIRLYMVII